MLFKRKKLAEAGKRNSSVDQARIQESHDHMVSLGAACEKATKEAATQQAISEALRVDDSFGSRIDALRIAAQAVFNVDYYDSPFYLYVLDCFDTDVVVKVADEIYQIPYTMTGDVATLGEPMEVDIAYIPTDDGELSEGEIPKAFRKRLSKKTNTSTNEIDSEKVTAPVTEAAACDLSGEYLQLREGAVAADGSAQIKIIQPGWGSSGYYPADVLKRDGPKIFSSGLKMFWDHQTAVEEAERPEGSLDDLAAELTGNARWQESGPEGPGLYAPIKAFEAYAPSINDLSKSIGVSIRAAGRAAKGKAPDGKEGPIIQSLESARSVDFVTSPGAGGKILQLFEAARRTTPQQKQESEMDVKNLQEANALLTAQAAQIATLQESSKEIAKLRESVLIGQAASFVGGKLTGIALPAITKQRIAAELVAQMPVKENALDTTAYEALVDAKVKEAVAEIAAITGAGEVRGMGAAPTADDSKTLAESRTSMEESFALLGLNESTAKLAAKGRAR
jgi:hypothetical protein